MFAVVVQLMNVGTAVRAGLAAITAVLIPVGIGWAIGIWAVAAATTLARVAEEVAFVTLGVFVVFWLYCAVEVQNWRSYTGIVWPWVVGAELAALQTASTAAAALAGSVEFAIKAFGGCSIVVVGKLTPAFKLI